MEYLSFINPMDNYKKYLKITNQAMHTMCSRPEITFNLNYQIKLSALDTAELVENEKMVD